MQTRVFLTEDRLEDEAQRFVRTPISQPLFLNSIPKSGTHLIKNIFRMFVPVEQHWKNDFIQLYNLKSNIGAFDKNQPCLSWGHLFCDDISMLATKGVRRIVLTRDPYDWVLSRARFFLSDQTSNPLDHLRRGNVSTEEILTIMILGVLNKTPSLASIYEANVIAWMGTPSKLVRYEDIVHHVTHIENEAAEEFFEDLFRAAGITPLPVDWRERITIGAKKQHSSTARENLTGAVDDIPSTLPETQRRILDYHAPGLRALLGYET